MRPTEVRIFKNLAVNIKLELNNLRNAKYAGKPTGQKAVKFPLALT